jgi:hypothetical protein
VPSPLPHPLLNYWFLFCHLPEKFIRNCFRPQNVKASVYKGLQTLENFLCGLQSPTSIEQNRLIMVLKIHNFCCGRYSLAFPYFIQLCEG